jgi:sporulation protein YlmC with PRC-barrel domain
MASSTNQKTRDALTADETAELISSEKIERTAVYDRKGDKIGTVHHLMINKYTGQVAYAVISFGGFLGIGAEYHPIPWRLLDYDEEVGGYVVDIDREQLEKAPRFAESREPDWADRGYTARIDEYWMIIP